MPTAVNHGELMDRYFGFQTSFYDVTRGIWIYGREQVHLDMKVSPEDRILEVGSGTGWNLRELCKKHHAGVVYGLDVSRRMLEYAREKIRQEHLENQIVLVECPGDTFSYKETFGLDQPFNKVFFSYSFSMIPNWQETFENIILNSTADATIWLTDFYDLGGFPGPLREGWHWWMANIHVRFAPELHAYLTERAKKHGDRFTVKGYLGNYYYVAKYEKLGVQK